MFAKKFPKLQLYGIDISKEAIRICKNKKYNVEQAYAHKLSFSNKSIDLVFHLDGMEHIPKEWENKTLTTQFNIAKKFVIHSIACHSEKDRDKYLKENYTPLHINIKKPFEWKEIIDQIARIYNFKLIYCNIKKKRLDLIYASNEIQPKYYNKIDSTKIKLIRKIKKLTNILFFNFNK